jgi:hypothetical protein
MLALLTGSSLLGGMFMTRSAHGQGDPDHHQFTNKDFKGNYGMLENGATGDGKVFLEIAQVRADGNGHIAIEAIFNIAGLVGGKGNVNCTYTTRPNGMGHMDCIAEEGGDQTAADFILLDGGREVHILTTAPNPEGYTVSTARRQ